MADLWLVTASAVGRHFWSDLFSGIIRGGGATHSVWGNQAVQTHTHPTHLLTYTYQYTTLSTHLVTHPTHLLTYTFPSTQPSPLQVTSQV